MPAFETDQPGEQDQASPHMLMFTSMQLHLRTTIGTLPPLVALHACPPDRVESKIRTREVWLDDRFQHH